MTKDELKQRVYQAIDQRGEEIIGLGEEIRRHPELGFKEVKTARLAEETFKKLGLAPRSGLAMTGVRAEVAGHGGEGPTFAVLGELDALGEENPPQPGPRIKEGKAARPAQETFKKPGLAPRSGLAMTGVRAEVAGHGGEGPTFAVLGELDALVVAGHPEGDPTTGAAHACGHNAQIAGMLGAAMGLLDARAFDQLAGRAVFFSVPAEEYGDIEWRVAQARAGKLEFLGGKPELLRLGHFDDVDLAMMIHTTSRAEEGKAGVPASNNGCIVKTVRYIGRAAHAGGVTHMGLHGAHSAQIGLMSINAVRQTFRDEDTIRVHPIITHGGSQA